MTHVDTQWALKSILELGHLHLRTHVSAAMPCISTTPPGIRVSALPRLLQTPDRSRLLVLAKRPNGVAGVELGFGSRLPWTPPSSLDGSGSTKQSKRTRLLAAYLQKQGFETSPPPPRSTLATRPPLILHANHLIAWKLNQCAAAFPLYAHTLAELQLLRRRELVALQPHNCLVANTYCEWDNWREVVGEPGWDFFGASDASVEQLLRDGVQAPLADKVDGVCRVEVS